MESAATMIHLDTNFLVLSLFPVGLDMASYAMAVMDTPFTKSHKPYMPRQWMEDIPPHTH